MSRVLDRLDEFQQGRRWLAFPVAVYKKFQDDSSGNLAVLITYYLLFSIFPLLLALVSMLGLLLQGHPDWQQTIEDGALSNFKQFPLIQGPTPKSGSVALVVIASLIALYSGLAVAKTAQNVFDIVYGIPRNERPGFVPKTLRALRLVLVGGLGFIATTIVSGAVTSGGRYGLHLGAALNVAGIAVTLVLNTLLFTVLFRWLTVRRVTFRQVLPGAILSAVSFVILQTVATALLTHRLSTARAQYGAVGGVLVLLAWFYLQSQIVVYSAQVNVVKQDHLWPRSLTEPPPNTDPT